MPCTYRDKHRAIPCLSCPELCSTIRRVHTASGKAERVQMCAWCCVGWVLETACAGSRILTASLPQSRPHCHLPLRGLGQTAQLSSPSFGLQPEWAPEGTVGGMLKSLSHRPLQPSLLPPWPGEDLLSTSLLSIFSAQTNNHFTASLHCLPQQATQLPTPANSPRFPSPESDPPVSRGSLLIFTVAPIHRSGSRIMVLYIAQDALGLKETRRTQSHLSLYTKCLTC